MSNRGSEFHRLERTIRQERSANEKETIGRRWPAIRVETICSGSAPEAIGLDHAARNLALEMLQFSLHLGPVVDVG